MLANRITADAVEPYNETERGFTMKRSGTPEGWHTVTPRIVVHGAQQMVEFVQQVFGGIGDYRMDQPCVIRIGDSTVMISDAGIRKPSPSFLYVYVEDADETHRRALQAGASSLEEPADMPYGDRRGMFEDPWGNTWQVATYRGDRSA
jgi:PhnB protein